MEDKKKSEMYIFFLSKGHCTFLKLKDKYQQIPLPDYDICYTRVLSGGIIIRDNSWNLESQAPS